MASAGVKIPHHTIRVFDESGNLSQIIHTVFLQDDDDDDDDVNDDNEGENDHDDCNEIDGRSEDDAEDSDDEDEETLLAVEQVGECLLDQDDQKLEELLKEEAVKEDSTA